MTVSITCPVCGATSHNPNDVSNGYCGNCHDWTGAMHEVDLKMPFDPVERHMYYDRQGHPLTLGRFCYLMESGLDYRQLAFDDLPDGIRISTVWLGVNYNFTMDVTGGLPIIFETAVFVGGKIASIERYSTEEEALHTHQTLKRSLELVGRQFLEQVLEEDT